MRKGFEIIEVPNFVFDEDVKNNGASILTDDYRRMALSKYAIEQLKEKGISNHDRVRSTQIVITTFQGIEKVEMIHQVKKKETVKH